MNRPEIKLNVEDVDVKRYQMPHLSLTEMPAEQGFLLSFETPEDNEDWDEEEFPW